MEIDKRLVLKSEEYCKREMGQKEKGQNEGFCEKYQRVLGLPKGSAYCYAGQFWCYEQAARDLNMSNPLPRSGLARSVFDWGKRGERDLKVRRHGFLVWRLSGTVFGHVERVKEVKRAGWVETYAFNVDDGSKIVKRNFRSPIGRKVFLGWVNVTE